MSVTNYKITAPVGDGDIKNVLGTSDVSLNQWCQNANVNTHRD